MLTNNRTEEQESTRRDGVSLDGESYVAETPSTVMDTEHVIDIVEENELAEEISEISVEMRQSIVRDLQFLQKYATNVDRDILLSLLLSEMDNPRRLCTIMIDILGIPNAVELINEFSPGSVDAAAGSGVDDGSKASNGDYFSQIMEMFPDADPLFLSKECDMLRGEEDYTRFINTVMLTEAYKKRGSGEKVNSVADDDVVVVRENSTDVISLDSSDDEITSFGTVDAKPSRYKRRLNSDSSQFSSVDSFSYGQSSQETPYAFRQVDRFEPPNLLPDGGTVGGGLDPVNAYYASVLRERADTSMNFLLGAPDPDWYSRRRDVSSNSPGSASRSDYSPGDSSFGNPDSSHRGGGTSPPHQTVRCRNEGSRGKTRSRCTREDSDGEGSSSGDDGKTGGDWGLASRRVSTSGKGSESRYDDGDRDEDGTNQTGEASEDWVAEKTTELIRLFPNTDPSFLREECVKFDGSLVALNEFVIRKLEVNDMPSKKEYEKRMELQELQDRYTNNFSIEDFLKIIPDPWAYFKGSNRNCAKFKLHSISFLKMEFRKHTVALLTKTLTQKNFNLYLTYKALKERIRPNRSQRRSNLECNSNIPLNIDIQYLQEAAFILNEERIKDYISAKEEERRKKFEEAKRIGSLLQCECCYDAEVMVEDIVYCPNEHSFCKSCLIKFVEVEMGQGKCHFSCLAGCGDNYTLASLQSVLKPELFSKVIQANQMEEINAAGIEDLVQCPFCNYATIMPPEVTVMVCLNPECSKESCRLCKELSHVPLKCDEVEKSEEVKLRTYIENKMTEALVRTCYRCQKKFVKEDGCNMMSCSCGAKMCYVCREPVSNYDHFNGQGGTEFSKCPLHSTNDELHVDLVQRVGEEAKAEILSANPDVTLRYDPTVILPERSYEEPMPGMDRGRALAAGMEAIRAGRANLERVAADLGRVPRDRNNLYRPPAHPQRRGRGGHPRNRRPMVHHNNARRQPL